MMVMDQVRPLTLFSLHRARVTLSSCHLAIAFSQVPLNNVPQEKLFVDCRYIVLPFFTDAFVYPYRVGEVVDPLGGGIIIPLPEPEGVVNEYVHRILVECNCQLLSSDVMT